MAKPSASDTIMASAAMKALLVKSKEAPVQAAIALTSEGEAVMLLDKKAKPRAVMALLQKQAKAAKIALNTATLRFGRAEVDPDYDAGTVRLFVNKDAGGAMPMKLRDVVKGISFQKVEIAVDAALDAEEGAEGQDAESGGAASAVQAELAELVKRIPEAGDAARQAMLNKVVKAIGAKLQAGDTEGAAQGVASLRQALDGRAGASGGATNGGGANAGGRNPADGAGVRVAKGLLLWNGTRSQVEQQLKTLTAAIIADSADEPDHEEIKAGTGAVMAIMDRLDDRLSAKLNAMRGASSAEAKNAITAEAKQIVAEYQHFVATDEMLADIDDNGFIPLDIKARLTQVLGAVLNTL